MRAKYLGLDLPSPIIVSSSPYTSNVKSVEQCAARGAGAVVLKSIFEEQILHHAARAGRRIPIRPTAMRSDYLQRYLGEDYKAGISAAGHRRLGVEDGSSGNRQHQLRSRRGEDWIEYATAMARCRSFGARA